MSGGTQITEQAVIEALSKVDDPELKRDLVSLGMVRDITIDGGRVSFVVVLTTPACPLKSKIEADCTAAVSAIPGVEEVEIGDPIAVDIDMSPIAT